MPKDIHEISLLDISPPSISKDETVQALINALNPELASVSNSIQDSFIVSRVNELPERVIDLLAWQWHVDFYEPDLDIATKRALVLNSIKYHKKKGTKFAITNALEALGFVPTIKEWFESEMQTPPHTFSITGYYKDDAINVDFLGEDTEKILTRVVEITKPVRSGMIYLLVAPPPIDLSEHICIWDFCTWEHFTEKKYNWGLLIPENPIFDDNSIFKRIFDRKIFAIHDSAFWDFNSWDCIPVRNLQLGPCSENAIIAELEWGNGEAALLSPALWDSSKWDYATTFTRTIGSSLERIFNANIDWDKNFQALHAWVTHNIVYDKRPRWNLYTRDWTNSQRWTDDFARDILQIFNGHRDLMVELNAQNLSTNWSKRFSWQNSKTWINSSITPCSWQIKSWEDD